MPGKGLSPLILPRLVCSQCGGNMDYHDRDGSENGKLAFPRGYQIYASCHKCRTSFEISLQHASGRSVIYQPDRTKQPEELEEIGQ